MATKSHLNEGVNCVQKWKKVKETVFSKGLFRRLLLIYYSWNKIIVLRDLWVFFAKGSTLIINIQMLILHCKCQITHSE